MYVASFFCARRKWGLLGCARAEVGLGGAGIGGVDMEWARLKVALGYEEIWADIRVYTETTSSRSAAASPTYVFPDSSCATLNVIPMLILRPENPRVPEEAMRARRDRRRDHRRL